MKLDNRPKKLLVQGASHEQLQSVRDWYEVRNTSDTLFMTILNGDTTDDRASRVCRYNRRRRHFGFLQVSLGSRAGAIHSSHNESPAHMSYFIGSREGNQPPNCGLRSGLVVHRPTTTQIYLPKIIRPIDRRRRRLFRRPPDVASPRRLSHGRGRRGRHARVGRRRRIRNVVTSVVVLIPCSNTRHPLPPRCCICRLYSLSYFLYVWSARPGS